MTSEHSHPRNNSLFESFHAMCWSTITKTHEILPIYPIYINIINLFSATLASFTLIYACNSNQIKHCIYSISKNSLMIIIKRAGTWNVVDSLFVGLNVVFTNSVHPHKLGVGALISTRFTYTGRRLATKPVILLLRMRVKNEMVPP